MHYDSTPNYTLSATKACAGQAIDSLSPELGLAYHIIATSTSNNDLDRALGLLGAFNSAAKILRN